jgi:hypothetical protein
MFPVEMWVPIFIFVAGIIVSLKTGSIAQQRLEEGQKAAGKNLASTAAYEAPFEGKPWEKS